MNHLTYALFGMGNIGRILAARLKAAGVPGERLLLCDAEAARAEAAAAEFGARPVTPEDESACRADVLLLAPPPKAVPGLLRQLAPHLTPTQVVVSFAAALPLEKLQALIPGIPLARVMPNAPSLVGQGMNPVAWGPAVTPSARERVQFVLDALGQSLETPDERMNWCVGLTGAAMRSLLPALEGMTRAGVEAGFAEAEARRMAAQVMLGTAALVLETDLSFDEIKSLTPMQTLDEAALAQTLLEAARAARDKTEANQQKLLEMTGL
ncbi:MAG: NAD(P)-binding domain-containing protein [Anaerolineales bacterium]